jgi:hypothetical protein
MPTKTSVGPNEVVRLEVLRLKSPLCPGRAWTWTKRCPAAAPQSAETLVHVQAQRFPLKIPELARCGASSQQRVLVRVWGVCGGFRRKKTQNLAPGCPGT